MIVVIAPEQDIPNEIDILHELFKCGLEYYHFRKPHKDYDAHASYLNQIDSAYHNRIVTHYFHELITDFNLKGIHFQEQKRLDTKDIETYIDKIGAQGKSISSSFHDPKILEKELFLFHYNLLSPVFSSISKQGYEGKGFDVNHIQKNIVGMGGINSKTIEKTLMLGFKGVGVLGGIWNASDPIASFTSIKKAYEKYTR